MISLCVLPRTSLASETSFLLPCSCLSVLQKKHEWLSDLKKVWYLVHTKRRRKTQDHVIIKRNQIQDGVYPTNTMSLGVWVKKKKINVLTKWYAKERQSTVQKTLKEQWSDGSHCVIWSPVSSITVTPERHSNISREETLKLSRRHWSQPPATQALSSWRVTAGVAMQGDSEKS